MHLLPPRLTFRSALTGLLLLSLLFAQWLGHTHAFAHGGAGSDVMQSADASSSPDGLFEHTKSAGNCAAFDAATLGLALHAAAPPPLLSLPAGSPSSLPLRSGWHRLFTAHFSTRAPPLNA